MTKNMIKVRKSYLFYLLILILLGGPIGEYFWINGDRYKGEFKEDFFNGKGKQFDSKGNLIEEGIYLFGNLISTKLSPY